MLPYVRAVMRLAGYPDTKLDQIVLTHVELRRLRRKARVERGARADGRRPARDPWESDDGDPGAAGPAQGRLA